MKAQESRRTASNDLRHEISHIYVARHLGLLHAVFAVPRWFDEGSAAYVSDLPWQTPSHLARYLAESPGLVSPLFLDGNQHWNVLYDGSKRYAHLRLFVSYLVDVHGQAKVIEYLRSLSISTASADTFKHVFGVALENSHHVWQAGLKAKGQIPPDTETEYPSSGLDVRGTVYLLSGILIGLWLIRQAGLAIRLAGRTVIRRRTGS